MPSVDVWNRILAKLKGNTLEDRFLELSTDPVQHELYPQSGSGGHRGWAGFYIPWQPKLEKILHPALILQASDNPVVDQRGSRQFFDKLGSKKKYYCQIESAQHIIINGEGADRVHLMIENFIRGL